MKETKRALVHPCKSHIATQGEGLTLFDCLEKEGHRSIKRAVPNPTPVPQPPNPNPQQPNPNEAPQQPNPNPQQPNPNEAP